jgi:hypothetical protein
MLQENGQVVQEAVKFNVRAGEADRAKVRETGRAAIDYRSYHERWVTGHVQVDDELLEMRWSHFE